MTTQPLISGKYRLQRCLGAGSMGEVWAARNEYTNRDFAVKFLRREFLQNQEAVNRFFLEARACGQIRHPAIVDVYDMGQAEDGSHYLVMELLEGEGFDERIARCGAMRAADVCRWVAFVSRGLQQAHDRGLIHRDLKPGNIFFAADKNGELNPKILDFGISKEITEKKQDFVRTSAGTVLGSPAYMSPEQARGEADVDKRADIWALGVIMYEALTEELPFDAANYNALMLAIISEPHLPVIERRPDCPPALSVLIDKLLSKNREDRIESAQELASTLERIYATLTSTPLTLPERTLSIPPLEAQTQENWLQATQAPPPKRISRSVIIGGGLASIGLLVAAASLSGSDGDEQADIARVSTAANTVMVRARSEFERATAEQRMKQAEQAARDAEQRAAKAEEKEKTRREQALKNQKAPAGGGTKKAAPSPHDGVDDAGF